MWQIQKKETCDIWTNNVCTLKIEHLENKCRVYVDYKGYNVIMPMGMWGFELYQNDWFVKTKYENMIW